MQIEKIEISKLHPAKYNPRKDLKPGDTEYEKFKRSMVSLAMPSRLFGIKEQAISWEGIRDTKFLKI